MNEDSHQRYQEILRNIAARRPFNSKPREHKKRNPHEQALDSLNAFDSLAQLTQIQYPRILCHGPKSITSPAWSGALIWYHRKGYHGYQTLSLLGIWSHYAEDDIILTIGLRALPYRAPIFDAGVYRVAIQNSFQLYYHDDGRPPNHNDRALYQAPFLSKERLIHRQALSACLDQWRTKMQTA